MKLMQLPQRKIKLKSAHVASMASKMVQTTNQYRSIFVCVSYVVLIYCFARDCPPQWPMGVMGSLIGLLWCPKGIRWTHGLSHCLRCLLNLFRWTHCLLRLLSRPRCLRCLLWWPHCLGCPWWHHFLRCLLDLQANGTSRVLPSTQCLDSLLVVDLTLVLPNPSLSWRL